MDRLALRSLVVGCIAVVVAGCVQVIAPSPAAPPSGAAAQTSGAAHTTRPAQTNGPAQTIAPEASGPATHATEQPPTSAGPVASPGSPVSGSGGPGSVVYGQASNIWLSAPDGSGARQLTSDGTDAAGYHDPSLADDGTVWAVKGSNALYHLDCAGHMVANPVTLPTLEHGAEGVAVSHDDRYIAYTTVGTGQYVDPRFGTPSGTFLYGGTDVANPDGTSVPGAVISSLLYPSWAGPTSLILADGVDLYFDSITTKPAQPTKWLSEQEGCLTDFDCPEGQGPAASLSNPTVSDDGSVGVYGYKPYFGPGGRRVSSAAGGVPGEPQTRCVIATSSDYSDNGSLNADGSAFFYDDTAFDSTTFESTVGQGIWSFDVNLDADDCGASKATLIVPGGSQPDWGPMAP